MISLGRYIGIFRRDDCMGCLIRGKGRKDTDRSNDQRSLLSLTTFLRSSTGCHSNSSNLWQFLPASYLPVRRTWLPNLLTQQDILLASLEKTGSQHKTQGDGSLGWTSLKKRSWGGAGQDHTAANWWLTRGRKWHRNKGVSCHSRQITAAGATVFRVDYLAILFLNWFYTTSWLRN